MAAAAMLASTDARASHEMCARLRAFHKAPFSADVAPAGRRWVELHWRGTWLGSGGWGKTCLHSPDTASTAFCAWLVANTSMEFPNFTPKRALECYGYRFPNINEWSDWKSDVSILSADRWMLFQIDFATLDRGEAAIRISSFDKDKDEALIEMPPIKALPPLKVKAD